MFTLDQLSSVIGHRIYFNQLSPQVEIDRRIADGDLEGLRPLMTPEKADKSMIIASMCKQGEIFDHLFETYRPKMETRGACVAHFANFGDQRRIERILDKGEIDEKSKNAALGHAIREGHESIVYRLTDLKISKNALKESAEFAKELGKDNLASFLKNKSEDSI